MTRPAVAAFLLLAILLPGCYYFREDLDKALNPQAKLAPPPPRVPAFVLEGRVQGDRRALAAVPGTGGKGTGTFLLRKNEPVPFLPLALAAGPPLLDLAYRDLSPLAGQILNQELRLVCRAGGVELARIQARLEDGRFRSEDLPLARVKDKVQALEVDLYRLDRPDQALASWVLPFERPGDGERLVQEVYLREDHTVAVRAWREAGETPPDDPEPGPVDGLRVAVDTDLAALGLAAGAAPGGVRRLSTPDGLHLYDADGDGEWGEEDDDAVLPAGASWTAARARVVDPDLAGFPLDDAARAFGTGLTVQDAVAGLELVVEPWPLAAGGAGALLRVLARPDAGVGLPLGAEVQVDVEGARIAAGGGTLVLDRISRSGTAYAERSLVAPARPGEVRVSATVSGRQAGTLAAELAVSVVAPAAGLSVADLSLDRVRALPGQAGLVATVRVRNDGAVPLEQVRVGLTASLAGGLAAEQVRVVQDPDNPDRVLPGRSALFRLSLEPDPTAPRGDWTLEAWASGRVDGVPVQVSGADKAAGLALVTPARLLPAGAPSLPVLAPGEADRVLELELANPGGGDVLLSEASLDFQQAGLTAVRTDTVASVPAGGTRILAFRVSAANNAVLGDHAWSLDLAATDSLDGRAVALEPAGFTTRVQVVAKPPAPGSVQPARVVAGSADAERTLAVTGAQFHAVTAAWLQGAGTARMDLEDLQVAGPTSLSARVPASAEAGIYSLRVQSASGASPTGPVVQVLARPVADTYSQEAVVQGRDLVLEVSGSDLEGVTEASLAAGGGQTVAGDLLGVRSGSLRLRFPGTLSQGDQTLRLVTAAGETTVSGGVRVLAAPQVDRVEPAATPAGQAARLTIHGQGFAGPVGEVQLSDGTVLADPVKQDDQTIQATLPATVRPGSYGVQVSLPWVGRSAATGAVLVVHRGVATVRVTGVDPVSGFQGAAQTLTVTGENLMGATAVTLVDDTGTSERREDVPLFHVDTDLQLTVTVPASVLEGDYRLEVVTPLGTGTGGPHYLRHAELLPSTDGCDPSAGPTDASTVGVLVSGENFTAGLTEAQLVDGDTVVADLTVTSVQGSTAFEATVPQGVAPGRYRIRAVVADVPGVDNGAVFVVNPALAPAVDGLDPPVKRLDGDPPVTVRGSGLNGALEARWRRAGDGLEFVAPITQPGATEMIVTAPDGMDEEPGDYDLRVTSSGGVTNAASAQRLRVPGPPRVSGASVLSVARGTTLPITLTGADLYAVERVDLVGVADVDTGTATATLAGTPLSSADGGTLSGLSAPDTVPAGEYHLRAVTAFGPPGAKFNATSGRTLQVLGPPVLAGYTPRGYDRALGGTVQVTGQDLRAGLSLRLRAGSLDVPLEDVVVHNPRRAEARVPAGLAADEYELVASLGADESVAADKLYLDERPFVDDLDPPQATLGQETLVQATGRGFRVRNAAGGLVDADAQAWWVGLDDPARVVPALDVGVDSEASLHATLPASLPPGRYALRVGNPWGTVHGGLVSVNGAPVVLAASVPELPVLRGEVDLDYTVADPDGDLVIVEVQYKLGDGDWDAVGRAATATDTTVTWGLAAPPGAGQAYRYTWDSAADTTQSSREAWLRVRAFGGVQGEWREVGPFFLDNNTRPALPWHTHPADVRGPVDLHLRVADPDADAVSLTVELDDGLGRWRKTRSAGGDNPFFVQADQAGAEAVFAWAADLDLPEGRRLDRVRLRYLLHDHALHEPVMVEGVPFSAEIGAPARTVAVHPAALQAAAEQGSFEARVTAPWTGVLARLGGQALERTDAGLLRFGGLEAAVPVLAAGASEHLVLVWDGSRVRVYSGGVLRLAGSVLLEDFDRVELDASAAVEEAAVGSWPWSDGGVVQGQPASAGSEVARAAAGLVPSGAPDGYLPRIPDPAAGAEDLSGQADGLRTVFVLSHDKPLHPLTGEPAGPGDLSVTVDGEPVNPVSVTSGGGTGSSAELTLPFPPDLGATVYAAYAFRGTIRQRVESRK